MPPLEHNPHRAARVYGRAARRGAVADPRDRETRLRGAPRFGGGVVWEGFEGRVVVVREWMMG